MRTRMPLIAVGRATCGLTCGLTSGLIPGVCSADQGPLGRRADWRDWSFDPVIMINVCLAVWLFSRGRAWWQSRAGAGAGHSPSRAAGIREAFSTPRAASFAIGILLLVVTLLSPLDAMAGQLSAAHMVQHMLLMTVIAPLLILGAPGLVCFCGMPVFSRGLVARTRRAFGRRAREMLRNPWLAATTYAVAMWAWHLPWPYQAALRHQAVHDLQHASFMVAALLFWRILLDPVSRQRLGQGQAVLVLFITTLHATVLGVLMTISPRPWYPAYAGKTQWWGLTPMEDQQLAGLIMWMPACAPYLVFAVVAFANLVSESSGVVPRYRPTPAVGTGRGRS